MARTAMTELQQQIEEVRREAFAAGYAAAMQAIQELASRSAPNAGIATLRLRGVAGRRRPPTTRAPATPTPRRPAGANEGAPRRRRSAAGPPEPGPDAQSIEWILK